MCRRCPKCHDEFNPFTYRCVNCGKLDTIGIDGNHSGFTETLGNVPLTRLLIAFDAWPDWTTIELLCDQAKVFPAEAYRYIELWEDKGIIISKMQEDGEFVYKLNHENLIAQRIMLLNSAIVNAIIEEDVKKNEVS